MSLRLVPALRAGTPSDPGLTGPVSVTWRVSREQVVSLGGLSALLLQLAHPLVAAGVAERSSLQDDPTRRLNVNERAELYRESESFGQLYGVGTDIRPVSYQQFQDYYARMLSRLAARLAAGLPPAELRAPYGLRWSAVHRALSARCRPAADPSVAVPGRM